MSSSSASLGSLSCMPILPLASSADSSTFSLASSTGAFASSEVVFAPSAAPSALSFTSSTGSDVSGVATDVFDAESSASFGLGGSVGFELPSFGMFRGLSGLLFPADLGVPNFGILFADVSELLVDWLCFLVLED